MRYWTTSRWPFFEAKDNYGYTPLHHASRNGHLNIVQYLTQECHSDVESKDKDGYTPLHYASENGHLN